MKQPKERQMLFLVKLPIRIVSSVFVMPFVWLKYLFTGSVTSAEPEHSETAPLIKRLNTLQFQNGEMKVEMDSLFEILSYHKQDIAEKIESNESLDEHEKSFCLDLTSSIAFLKKFKDSEAQEQFLKRMRPAIESLKSKTKLNPLESSLLEKCQRGDKGSFLLYFQTLVTRTR